MVATYTPPTLVEVLVAAICRDREDETAWAALSDELQENGVGDQWRWVRWAKETGRWPASVTSSPLSKRAAGWCWWKWVTADLAYRSYWINNVGLNMDTASLPAELTGINRNTIHRSPESAWLAFIAAASEVPSPENTEP